MTVTFNWYEIPTSSNPQQFTVTLNGVEYQLTFAYRNNPLAGWTLDIANSSGVYLACGIPLVTGTDLLGQYAYLGIGGPIVVGTDGDFNQVPTFDNLGTTSHVWFGVPA